MRCLIIAVAVGLAAPVLLLLCTGCRAEGKPQAMEGHESPVRVCDGIAMYRFPEWCRGRLVSVVYPSSTETSMPVSGRSQAPLGVEVLEVSTSDTEKTALRRSRFAGYVCGVSPDGRRVVTRQKGNTSVVELDGGRVLTSSTETCLAPVVVGDYFVRIDEARRVCNITNLREDSTSTLRIEELAQRESLVFGSLSAARRGRDLVEIAIAERHDDREGRLSEPRNTEFWEINLADGSRRQLPWRTGNLDEKGRALWTVSHLRPGGVSDVPGDWFSELCASPASARADWLAEQWSVYEHEVPPDVSRRVIEQVEGLGIFERLSSKGRYVVVSREWYVLLYSVDRRVWFPVIRAESQALESYFIDE